MRLHLSLVGIFLLSALYPVSIMSQENSSSSYTIFDTSSGDTLQIDQVLEKCLDKHVVFFGEEHDDSIAHMLQDNLFRELHNAKKGKLALSMEMFEKDVQVVLDEYGAGLIKEKNLINDGRAWNNYDTDYKPLVEYAKANHLSMIAANAPRRYVSLVNREGPSALDKLPKAAYDFLPPIPYHILEGAYAEKFNQAMGGDTDHMGTNLYASQNLWDATMAHSIASYWRKHKEELIFHLNGRFHSDQQLGTVAQLKRIRPKIETLTISCFPADSDDATSSPTFNKIADIVIIH